LTDVHALESDTLYRQYVRETVKPADWIARYRWHDTAALRSERDALASDCRHSRYELPVEVFLVLGSVALIFASWWSWFGARRS
jgi:hypothetical protein